MNRTLFYTVLFFMCLALSQSAEAKLEVSTFWERNCDDGTCKMVLYSSPRWIEGPISWKRVGHSYLVNETWVIYPYDKIDWDTYLWVKEIDKNGNIVLCRNVSEKMRDVDIPLKDSLSPVDITMKYEPGVEYCSLFSLKDYDSFEFGEHSTSISLSAPGTENQRDALVRKDFPDSNFGSETFIDTDTRSAQNIHSYIMWNITSPGIIPAGQQIDEAIVSLYHEANGFDGHIVSVHHVNDTNWTGETETSLTYNNQVCGTGFNLSNACNLTAEDSQTVNSTLNIRWNWTVTQMVGRGYDDGDRNVSIVFKPSGSLLARWSSKENSNATRRPILYITYSAAVGDTTNPIVTLNSPVDNQNFTVGTIDFNCTASDETLLSNVSLYGNWSGWHLNVTNTTPVNNTPVNFTMSLIDGDYIWNCEAKDNSSNAAFATSNFTFHIDTIHPDLNFVSPTLANNTETQNVSWIFVNVSASEELGGCLLDNTSTNQTMTVVFDYCWINLTGLANRTSVYFRAYGNDTLGNLNVTEDRNITVNLTAAAVDAIAPDVNMTIPHVNGTNAVNQSWQFWNATSTEDIGSCEFEINGSNTSGTQVDNGANSYCFFNQTGLTTNQTTCALAFINDAAGNWNQTSFFCRNINIQPGAAPPAINRTVCRVEPILTTNQDNEEIEIGWEFDCSTILEGTFLGDMIYGEMWNYTVNASAWSFDIDAANVYYNLTGLNNINNLNGFTSTQAVQTAGGSYLTANLAGTYKVSFSLSFQAALNNALYGIGIAQNFDITLNRNCYARRWATKNQAGNVADTCIMSLAAGDTVNMQIENEETNRDIKVHTANFNLIRIAD